MSTKNDLQVKYSQLIQEVGAKHAAADVDRIKQIMTLCNELLDIEQKEPPDDAGKAAMGTKMESAIKEADSALAWLKEQAVTQTVNGEDFPVAAFAYAPDPEKPSTWRLPLWDDLKTKISKVALGRAAAALSPGGLSGKKADIPTADLSAVKAKIRAGYRSLNIADADIPKWVMEAQSRELVADYTPLTESSGTKNGKGVLTIIRPGFNSSKGRYYPHDVLARDLKVFEGVKMYADHPTDAEDKARPERSIKDWVASLGTPTVGKDGIIEAPYTVVEPWFEAKLATLRDKGMLGELGVSINAIGEASKQEIQGVKTNLIERLVRARSVDFVTEAGAGGTVNVFESNHAETDIDLIDITQLKEHRPDLVKLVEAEIEYKNKSEVKNKMAIEQELATLKESSEKLTKENGELKAKITEADKAKARAEAQAVIKDAIAKATLPDAAKAKLTAQFAEAIDAKSLEQAIKAEGDYIAALKESGKPRLPGSAVNVTESAKIREDQVKMWMASGMSKEKAEMAASAR